MSHAVMSRNAVFPFAKVGVEGPSPLSRSVRSHIRHTRRPGSTLPLESSVVPTARHETATRVPREDYQLTLQRAQGGRALEQHEALSITYDRIGRSRRRCARCNNVPAKAKLVRLSSHSKSPLRSFT
jgi:hypothetical protein